MDKHRHFHNQGGHCCEKKDEDCSCGGHFSRRYQTKEEERSTLETYLANLKLEVQAVEERLVNLKK